MKKDIYLCGPMTGLPDHNRAAFAHAALALRGAGYTVATPAENGLPADAPWAEHMRADIKLLMDCHAIALLPGAEASRGARLELHIAKHLQMKALSVGAWLMLAVEAEDYAHG